jgi:hypothetical protein
MLFLDLTSSMRSQNLSSVSRPVPRLSDLYRRGLIPPSTQARQHKFIPELRQIQPGGER